MATHDQLTEKQKAAIADVAIASAELESEIERCIIDLCRLWPGHGQVLLSSARLEAKLNLFRQLIEAEQPDSKAFEDFSEVIDELKRLTSTRNTVIHGSWIPLHWTLNREGSSYKRARERPTELVARRSNGKKDNTISATKVAKVATLMSLNRALLHQLFWEHFRDRVSGLSGLPTSPEIPASQLRLKIQKLGRGGQ